MVVMTVTGNKNSIYEKEERYISEARRYLMEPDRRFRKLLLGLTVFLYAIMPIIIGIAFGSSGFFGVLACMGIFTAPIITGLYISPYRVTENRMKSILKMIDDGDLIAAINALEGLTAGNVFLVTVYKHKPYIKVCLYL